MARPSDTPTTRHEVQLRWKRYRVFVYDGAVIRIDSINPTMGEKIVYRRVALNGRVAAQIKARLVLPAKQEAA